MTEQVVGEENELLGGRSEIRAAHSKRLAAVATLNNLINIIQTRRLAQAIDEDIHNV